MMPLRILREESAERTVLVLLKPYFWRRLLWPVLRCVFVREVCDGVHSNMPLGNSAFSRRVPNHVPPLVLYRRGSSMCTEYTRG